MKFKLKNMPLAMQIWLVCGGTMVFICLLIAIFLPWILRSFFTKQVFDILKDSQNSITYAKGVSPALSLPSDVESAQDFFSRGFIGEVQIIPMHQNKGNDSGLGIGSDSKGGFWHLDSTAGGMPVVRHLIFANELRPQESALLPSPFLQLVEGDAMSQQDNYSQYSREIGGKTLFYVVRKILIGNTPGYLVSFSWGSYRNDLVSRLLFQLLLLMVLLFLVSLLPSIWLARYLSRPLVQLESRITRIAERDWHEPFSLDRKDEIGKLAQTFEAMRQRLVRQDQTQQTFLQNVSHELKTPVMVIHSYAQSILDGIYPKGDLQGSIDVINSEAERLEKRTRDLLSLTKVSYLASRPSGRVNFDLTALVKERVERFRWRRSELDWRVELDQVQVYGDQEQWGIAVENILDNMIRYAAGRIEVTLTGNGRGGMRLRFWNDGPELSPQLKDRLFNRFQTGKGGEFGLGLAIVKRIADFHQAKVAAANENGGAAFYLEMGYRQNAH